MKKPWTDWEKVEDSERNVSCQRQLTVRKTKPIGPKPLRLTAIEDQSSVIEDGDSNDSQKTTIVQGPNKNLPTDDESNERHTQARETRVMSGWDSSLLNDFLSDDNSWEFVVPKKPAPNKAVIDIGN